MNAEFAGQRLANSRVSLIETGARDLSMRSYPKRLKNASAVVVRRNKDRTPFVAACRSACRTRVDPKPLRLTLSPTTRDRRSASIPYSSRPTSPVGEPSDPTKKKSSKCSSVISEMGSPCASSRAAAVDRGGRPRITSGSASGDSLGDFGRTFGDLRDPSRRASRRTIGVAVAATIFG
jgi:hypothetical protein